VTELLLSEKELYRKYGHGRPDCFPEEMYTGKTYREVEFPERELYRKYGHGRPGSFPKEKFTRKTYRESLRGTRQEVRPWSPR
jgi:hypothetical protein